MTDFFVADFNGTGNLTAYVPDTGSALTAPVTGSLLNGPPCNPSPGLASSVRNTAGSWQFFNDNVSGASHVLYTAQAPTSANYYMETTLLLPGTGRVTLQHAHAMRGTRGTGADANYFDALGMAWNIDQSDNTHRTVDGFVNSRWDRSLGGGPQATWGSPSSFSAVALGANPSVVLRTEVEGRALRAFVDGVLVLSTTWSGTAYYDVAGKFMWQFSFYDSGNPYTDIAIDSQKAGDSFLPPPPVIGAFWTEYVKTSEVDA